MSDLECEVSMEIRALAGGCVMQVEREPILVSLWLVWLVVPPRAHAAEKPGCSRRVISSKEHYSPGTRLRAPNPPSSHSVT